MNTPTGKIGEVYTTQTGMEFADPYEHDCGWEQVSPNERVKRTVTDFQTRIPYRVWDRGPNSGILIVTKG